MAIGTVTKYNGFEKQIAADANRQWDDATAGNIMFCLCGNGYTPAATHTTTANLTGIITSGDGAPIVAAGVSIDNTTTPGSTYFKTNDANFGSAVTITAKYLVAVMSVTAGTFDASTSKLLFYVNLDTTSSSATVSSVSSDFVIYTPTNGWIKTT